MKGIIAQLKTVQDKATAHAAAAKITELINKVNELAQKYEGIKLEVQAAMNKR